MMDLYLHQASEHSPEERAPPVPKCSVSFEVPWCANLCLSLVFFPPACVCVCVRVGVCVCVCGYQSRAPASFLFHQRPSPAERSGQPLPHRQQHWAAEFHLRRIGVVQGCWSATGRLCHETWLHLFVTNNLQIGVGRSNPGCVKVGKGKCPCHRELRIALPPEFHHSKNGAREKRPVKLGRLPFWLPFKPAPKVLKRLRFHRRPGRRFSRPDAQARETEAPGRFGGVNHGAFGPLNEAVG